MNKDFHYYATYFAARVALFPHEEALTIAHAAQYVDVSTKDKIISSLLPGLSYTTPTLESNFEMFLKTSWMTKDSLEETERIWSAFHFLPGNIHKNDHKKNYTGAKEWGYSFWRSTYDKEQERCFSLMCLPNSVLSELMINDAIGHKNDSYYLELLGVRMHVLADTWAHSYYAGTPTWWINDVSGDVFYTESGQRVPFYSVKHITDISRENPFGAMPPLFSFTSYAYLGHGRMGHVPDEPYMNYRYIPHWSSTQIEKNNPSDYLKAFRQMVKALQCALTGKTFQRDTYADIEAGLSAQLDQAFKRKDYKEKIADKIWNPIIKQHFQCEIPDYNDALWLNEARNASIKRQTHYYRFNEAAMQHLNLVQKFISENEKPLPYMEMTDYLIFHVRDGDRSKRVSSHMNYKTHDNSNWSAQFKDGKFVHYPNGDKAKSHTSDHLNYIEGDTGYKWRATFNDGMFTHTPVTGSGKIHDSRYIHYQTWDGTGYWANFVNWHEVGFDYTKSDFRKLKLKVFGFRRRGEEVFHSVSTKIFTAEPDNIYKFVIEKSDKENKYRLYLFDGQLNLVDKGIFYEADNNFQNSFFEIKDKKFIVNGKARDSIITLNWDDAINEVFIVDWYDF